MKQLAWILWQDTICLAHLVISAGAVKIKLHLRGPNA